MDPETRERVQQTAEYIVRKDWRVSDIFRKRLYEKDTRFTFLSPRRSQHDQVVEELEKAVYHLRAKRKHRTEEEHIKERKWRKYSKPVEKVEDDDRDRLAIVPMGTLASYMNNHKERKPYEVLDVERILTATPSSPVTWSTASTELKDKVEAFYSLLEL
ncbi:hypothetical protein GpartN1_g3567.t1 [Galdieria partita]|uniref:Uncharacterized protein n=1 Tax=Galdieria partita TaxID=83374 RepID=A0A9C7PXP6_9RHOD|nr:hypothetical protein GpartN1_g3567.t1 [Galdieria partita]